MMQISIKAEATGGEHKPECPIRNVLVLEFNELCPSLLDKWMGMGSLPHFRQFYYQSKIFTTTADDSAEDVLAPWVQWYSIHTGLSAKKHGVRHLGEGVGCRDVDLWHLLLERGHRVINWSSMNTAPIRHPNGMYFPDPWTNACAHPSRLAETHRLLSSLVQEHSDGSWNQKAAALLRLGVLLPCLGLRVETCGAIAKQLLSDVFNPQLAWRRAAVFDRIVADLFTHCWLRFRPSFATLFLNSTAHYQHAYWHYMDKDEPCGLTDAGTYGRAVLYGYQFMDHLLERFMGLARSDTLLILMGALSQQSRPDPHRLYYRIHNPRQLFAQLDISPAEYLPAMGEECTLRFTTETSCRRAEARLRTVTLAGREVFAFKSSNALTLFGGCGIDHPVSADAHMSLPDGGSALFHKFFYPLPTVKTGVHHPDGVFWIRSGGHTVHTTRISVLDVFPMIIEMLARSMRPIN